MALELKMISRYFNSTVTRFAVRYRCVKNSREHSTRQTSNLSYSIKSFPSKSQCLIKCASNCLHQSNCITVSHKNLTRQCSSDVIQLPKCVKCPSNQIFPKNSVTRLQTSCDDLLFRQFDSKCFESPYLLQANKNTLEYLRGLPKTFFFRRKKSDGKKPKRRIPKLILIQNPFTWLMIKIDFSVLRNIWDPSFTEKEFKYGTKEAISRVTNVISDGQFAELNGLLTKAARLSLMRELDRNWSEKQRSLLALNHEDIQISSPRKVYFIRIADKKYCDVDMAFLALKWAPINSIEALIFTEIFARFHREYTPHSIPEWTIAYFKVTRFEVLRKKPKIT